MNPSSPPCRPVSRTLLCLLLASALAGVPAAAHAQKAAAKKGTPAAGSRKKMPSEAEMKALVRQTLLDYDKGLETKDFSQLYASLAPTTRKHFTKEQITGLYAKQIEQFQRTDYADKTVAVFDPAPEIDPQGVLILSGHVPSEPQWVVFRLKYLNEGGWKPYAMIVRVQNSDTAPSRLPNAGEKELPPGKVKDPNAPAAVTPAPSIAPTGSATPGYVSPFAAPAPPAAATPASTPAAVATPGLGTAVSPH